MISFTHLLTRPRVDDNMNLANLPCVVQRGTP